VQNVAHCTNCASFLCRLAPRRHLRHCVREIAAGHDRVAPVNALGLVPGELHRHRTRDAGAFEVPHVTPPQVVNQPARKARLLARGAPRAPVVDSLVPLFATTAELLALAMEDPRHHSPGPALELLVTLPLR